MQCQWENMFSSSHLGFVVCRLSCRWLNFLKFLYTILNNKEWKVFAYCLCSCSTTYKLQTHKLVDQNISGKFHHIKSLSLSGMHAYTHIKRTHTWAMKIATNTSLINLVNPHQNAYSSISIVITYMTEIIACRRPVLARPLQVRNLHHRRRFPLLLLCFCNSQEEILLHLTSVWNTI